MKFLSLMLVSFATILLLGCSASETDDAGSSGDEILPIGTAKHVSPRGE